MVHADSRSGKLALNNPLLQSARMVKPELSHFPNTTRQLQVKLLGSRVWAEASRHAPRYLTEEQNMYKVE